MEYGILTLLPIGVVLVSDLKPSPGIREAIFEAADRGQLLAACRKFGQCRIGHASDQTL